MTVNEDKFDAVIKNHSVTISAYFDVLFGLPQRNNLNLVIKTLLDSSISATQYPTLNNFIQYTLRITSKLAALKTILFSNNSTTSGNLIVSAPKIKF